MFKRAGVSLGKRTKPNKSDKHCIWPAPVCISHLCFSERFDLKLWNCCCLYSSSTGPDPRWKIIPRCIYQLHFFNVTLNWVSWCSVKWGRKYSFTSSWHIYKVCCANRFFTPCMPENSKEQRLEAKPVCRELAAFASAVQKNEASSEYLLQMGTDVENWFGGN